MKYTKATGEKSTVKVTFEFTADEWADATQKAYLGTRARYSAPGFRKGKVPRPVLENYYGKSLFFEDAINYLYSVSYGEMLEKEKDSFAAVGDPEVAVDELNENGLRFTCVVPVKPEVKIDAYTGLKIKKHEYNVTDGDVDKEIERFFSRNAEAVEIDRACKDGDVVNIDFAGTVDGVAFPGGTAEEYDLELGSNTFIPGFESQLVGMAAGDTRDIKVRFPKDYQSENLRDKESVFAIKLNKVKAKQLPPMTDEYIKERTGVATFAEYKAKTAERLKRQAADRSRDETENAIIEAIKKHTTVDIPVAMIEKEVDGMVNEFASRLKYQHIKLDEYIRYMGTTMEAFREQYREQARSRVLSQLIISHILNAEKFTASESEIEERLKEQAASVDKTLEAYKKSIDPRQIEYIRNDIIITKLFKFLTENNELHK